MKNSHNCLTALSLIVASSCIVAPAYAANQYGKKDIQNSGTASVSGGNLSIGDDQTVTDRGSDCFYGGYAGIYSGTADSVVTVTDSHADVKNVSSKGKVSGGTSTIYSGSGQGTTTGCSLTINGGTYGERKGSYLYGEVSGGCVDLYNSEDAQTGTATENSLEVSGNAILNCKSYGGFVEYYKADNDNATVNGNFLSISESTANESVYGGAFESRIYSSFTSNVTVDKNSINVISSKIVEQYVYNSVYGGYIYIINAETLSTNNNIVKIEKSEVEDSISGGCIDVNYNGTVSNVICQENTVEIKDSVVCSVSGGTVKRWGSGDSESCIESATVSSNHVYPLRGFGFSPCL